MSPWASGLLVIVSVLLLDDAFHFIPADWNLNPSFKDIKAVISTD